MTTELKPDSITAEPIDEPQVITGFEYPIEPAIERSTESIPAVITEADQPLDAPLEPHVEPTSPWPKSRDMQCWYGLCWGLEWLFGLGSVIGSMAVLAAIPLLNVISLGYLLEASGRV